MAMGASSGNYLKVSMNLSGMTAFTASVMIKPTTLEGCPMAIWQDGAALYQFAFFVSATPAAYVYTNGAYGTPASISITAGEWVHLAMCFGGGTLELYINGALSGSVAAPGAIATKSTGLGVGAAQNGSKVYTGDVAEANIWTRKLSADEVVMLAKGLSAKRVPSSLLMNLRLVRERTTPAGYVMTYGTPTVTDHPRIYL